MKTIITEKPSVAREIASVLNITNKSSGYFEGNGYYITWAFGHLIELCPPEEYGWKEWSAAQLPMIPEEFKLRPSHKFDAIKKTWYIDKGIADQLSTVKGLFEKSDEIIVATDAGREGELIFRYIYQFLSCKLPFKRLWISSLTNKSILKGFGEMVSGTKYDNLFLSARNRSESDWLVGMNASRALSIAAGRGTFSLGRVQTPTLSIICSRYLENKNFKPTPFYTLKIILEKNEIKFHASSEQVTDKAEADNILARLRTIKKATVTSLEKKEITEAAPLLYDLTSLQMDANKFLSLTADETLKVAQSLYEQKFITYPRTGSCYISEDVFETIPELLLVAEKNTTYGSNAQRLGKATLNKRAVNDEKITDHHAILITETAQHNLMGKELEIYEMVLSRMLESFSPSCKKDFTSLSIECAEVKFKSTGSVITSIGWRDIKAKIETDDEEGEAPNKIDSQILPDVAVNEILDKKAEELLSKMTKPKALLNEATLLSSMETCGKNIEDETLKEALKDCGIGTPATRANVIETLLHRGYIERQKKLLIPTPKGLAVHDLLKSKPIASPELTGLWEKRLNEIATGAGDATKFMEDIVIYANEVTVELLAFSKSLEGADLATSNQAKIICPKCNKGEVKKGDKNYWCTEYKNGCDFKIWLTVAEKKISDKQVTDLLQKKKTTLIKGFKSKAGKDFEAKLFLDNDFKVKFEFANASK